MRQRSYSIGISAMFLSSLLMGACQQGPDPKDQVSKELKDARLDDVNVDYDSSNKVLHLKGEVNSPTDSTRAEAIASRVVGTSGRVANELTVAGVNNDTANDMDGAIRRELNAKIANDKMLMDRSVNFDVNQGVVTIKGEVKSEAERKQIGDLAKETPNVRDVVNALTLEGAPK